MPTNINATTTTNINATTTTNVTTTTTTNVTTTTTTNVTTTTTRTMKKKMETLMETIFYNTTLYILCSEKS